MKELQGRVALVTGAASGIGAATASVLSARGAQVIGFDINGDPGRSIQAVDVTDESAVAEAHAELVSAYGRVDLLVNGAGVSDVSSISELDLATYDRTMSVHTRAPLVLSKLVIPGMVKQGSGSIVNIGSAFGLLAREDSVAYSVSKAAVIHLTRAMAVDLKDSGVRVNCVCPGLTKTAMTGRLFTEDARAALAKNTRAHSLRRYGRPEEVAEAIAFLASDRASPVSRCPWTAATRRGSGCRIRPRQSLQFTR